MSDATKHFQAGRLSEAVTAALAEVKARPGDTARRLFLAELLCFAGELERADRQLDVVADRARPRRAARRWHCGSQPR